MDVRFGRFDTIAPDVFSFSAALGLILAVAVGAGWLWAASWVLLRPFAPYQRRLIGAAVAVGSLMLLTSGWFFVGSPTFFRFLSGDYVAYQRVIAPLSESLGDGEGPSRWSDRQTYIYLMAGAQRVFGVNSYVSATVNAALMGTLVLVMADTTRVLFGRRVAVAAATLLIVLPGLLVFTGRPNREILISLLTMATLALLVRIATPGHGAPLGLPVLLVASLVALWLLWYARYQLVPPMLVGLAVAVALRFGSWRPVRRAGRRPELVAGAALLIAGVAVIVAPRLYRALDRVAADADNSLFRLARSADSRIRPEIGLDPASPASLLADAPAAISRALWGPPPTTLGSIDPLFVAEAAVWWVLTPLLLVGLWAAARDRRWPTLVPVVAALAWAALSGWTLGNWGIVGRMRLTSWLLLLPVVALGLVTAFDAWRAHRRIDKPLAPPEPGATEQQSRPAD